MSYKYCRDIGCITRSPEIKNCNGVWWVIWKACRCMITKSRRLMSVMIRKCTINKGNVLAIVSLIYSCKLVIQRSLQTALSFSTSFISLFIRSCKVLFSSWLVLKIMWLFVDDRMEYTALGLVNDRSKHYRSIGSIRSVLLFNSYKIAFPFFVFTD